MAAATCSAVAPERACLVSCILPLLSHCRASCSRHCSSSLRDWSRSTPEGAHGARSRGRRPDGLGPQTQPRPQTTCRQQLCLPSPHKVSDSPSQRLRGIHLKLLPAQEHKDHICTKLHVSTSSYIFVNTASVSRPSCQVNLFLPISQETHTDSSGPCSRHRAHERCPREKGETHRASDSATGGIGGLVLF